jgi:hypothetical protein
LPGVVEARASLNPRRVGGAARPAGACRCDATRPGGGLPVTVVFIADPQCTLPSSEPTHHDVLYFACTKGLLWVNETMLVGVHGTAILLAVHGNHRPGPEVDPVTVAQGNHVSGRYLAAVN